MAGDAPVQWVTAYYAGFYWDWTGEDATVALNAVDVSTMTHLVFARYAVGGGTLGGAPGDLLPGAGTGHAAVEAGLIARAHAAGIKAIMMVGGEGEGPGWDSSTADPGTRATLIANLVAQAVSLGYDGIDIDWEENLDTAAQQAQAVALLTELRTAANQNPFYAAPHAPVILTWPGPWCNINYAIVTPWHVQIASLVDQYNVMTYAMAGAYEGWQSWHFAALTGAGAAYPTAVDISVNEYVQAGVPAGKLGVGIGLYALSYGSPVTGPRQDLGAAGVNGDDVTNNHRELESEGAFKQAGGVLHWDDDAKQSYYSYNPAWTRASGEVVSYLSYENGPSIAAKGEWARSQGLGGAIVWTINYGLVGDTENASMQAVKKAFLE
jgi:GH18 family chitinase